MQGASASTATNHVDIFSANQGARTMSIVLLKLTSVILVNFRLACRCAKETIRRGNEFFSLQSLGECWTTRSKEQRPDYRTAGISDSCIGVDFESCDDNSDTECVGQRLANYIYKIPDPNEPDSIDQLLLESLANYSATALDQTLSIIANQTGRSRESNLIHLDSNC